MNEAPVLINIYLLHPNPYQVRQVEDAAAVAELAANIEKNSLLQPPTVRVAGLQYEIAFGHTRRAAYKLLAQQGKTEFEEMPCFVRELDDLQMFEMAVAENIKRRDLNPIERARAMQTYMAKFEKTSSQTGEFFGCDEATVRGSVRLLGLPEVAQAKLSAGEITVGAARSLLTLERVAPERVEAAMTSIVTEHKQPDEAILSELKHSKTAVTLQESYDRRKEPYAGEDLWPLNCKKFPTMPKLSVNEALNAGAVDKKSSKDEELVWTWIRQLEGGLVAAEALVAQGAPEETVEKLAHLVNPPACDQCPFYVAASGTHVCGWKVCWDRKKLAWVMAEAEKLSDKLGILMYDAERDGEYVDRISEYSDEQKKVFADRIPGLRLMVMIEQHYWAYPFTVSKQVKLVDVTPENVQAKKNADAKAKEAANQQGEEYRQRVIERKKERDNAEISELFAEKIAVPVFATIWDQIKNQQVFDRIFHTFAGYFEDENDEEVDADDVVIDEKNINLARFGLTIQMLNGMVSNDEKIAGPVVVAERLQAVAREWDVKLPEDWLEKAQAFAENPPKPETEEDEEENDEEEDQ